ncbi:DUF2169 domain-containing protein [Xanthomonas sp. WHRI 10064A]|uniref:DUF2169 family type VI secretion system accessory protein n=1 Tax=unclassified Xanthomonas TaxID=2643310 RepID=UPI002B239BB9|nr:MULTISPECIES: DUF2169 domain-containing protein [unclassified Xanthomonas]MEA9585914.1 DUF2169 domain-containing protein [Xanthomonas sp. WHRI 10064B]MEA9614341.1 DUF2169 domain-containing protein [Xanthomonas sp. WHRI 10064A]
MDVENHSPFPHMVIEKATTKGRYFDVIIVVGSFSLAHGQPALAMDEQIPINCTDRYLGAPESSPFVEETHLVVAKQRTDIHVIGHARSPDGKPLPQWPVGVRVGPVSKTAMVTGMRAWNWMPLRGWHLTKPEPATAVPLHAGMAYGGAMRRAGYRGPPSDDIHDDAAFDTYQPNPVGRGYVGDAELSRSQYYLASQIEEVQKPLRDIRERYAPVCFGPVARWNPQRARHAGTYDDAWRAEHFPYLPADFDFAFYQSAQPDLIAPGWLQGDEPITLVGCDVSGRIDSQLPGIDILAVLGDKDGLKQPLPLRLDTVTIDLDTQSLQLVWRRTVPKEWGLRSVMLAAIPAGPAQRGAAQPIHIHRNRLPSEVQRG